MKNETRTSIRNLLSWHLDFPDFEKRYWWNEQEWVPFKNLGKKSNNEPPEKRQELKAAIVWEVLRRHPLTREMLQDFKSSEEAQKLPTSLQSAFSQNPPDSFKFWLGLYGLQSWASIGKMLRARIQQTLLRWPRLPPDSRDKEGKLSSKKRIGGHIIRDLLDEANRKANLIFEPQFQPGKPFIYFHVEPAKGTKHTNSSVKFSLDGELHSLIDKYWRDGFLVIPIASSWDVTEREFMRHARKLYERYFKDLSQERTRFEPLPIIEKFETNKLKRTNEYSRKVNDLRPYRTLIDKYSEEYGFPKVSGKQTMVRARDN